MGVAPDAIGQAQGRHELPDLVGAPGVGLADQDQPEAGQVDPQRGEGLHQDALVLVRALRSDVQDVAVGQVEASRTGPSGDGELTDAYASRQGCGGSSTR